MRVHTTRKCIMTTVTTTTRDGDREVTVDYNFGDSGLEASVSLFGETVVHNVFVANGVIKLQAYIRSLINQDERLTNDQIDEKVEAWTLKPRAMVDKVSKAKKALDNLTPTERAELIAEHNAELNSD